MITIIISLIIDINSVDINIIDHLQNSFMVLGVKKDYIDNEPNFK